jgi:hypothetical protein
MAYVLVNGEIAIDKQAIDSLFLEPGGPRDRKE